MDNYINTFTGSPEEYNQLRRKITLNEIKIKILSTPAHLRKREFGDILNEFKDIHVTERRVYA